MTLANKIALPRQFAAGKGKWVGAKIGMVAATDAGQNMGGNCHFKYFSVIAK
ncbi:hypothetical protein GYM74_05435 [Gilliamella sp. ESL0405]|nr:hypothetical protein GYM74_05435 [Gilliamella sp. ESL0405]